MRRVLLLLSVPVLLLGVPLTVRAADDAPLEAPFDQFEMSRVRDLMVRAINRERLRRDLRPVTYNPLLEKAAQAHAVDMLENFYLSHKNLQGQRSGERIKQTGYIKAPCSCSWKYWTGENIAWGQKTIREVMKDWMNSKDHRANILNPNFKEVGIGIDDVFWVQNFGGIQTMANARRSLNAQRRTPTRM